MMDWGILASVEATTAKPPDPPTELHAASSLFTGRGPSFTTFSSKCSFSHGQPHRVKAQSAELFPRGSQGRPQNWCPECDGLAVQRHKL